MIKLAASFSSHSHEKRRAVGYFIKNAPFAMIASALPGAANYIIILYLSYSVGFDATGTYRILFSFCSLLGLAAMAETNKVFVRAIVAGDKESATALFVNKAVFATAAALVLLLIFIIGIAADKQFISPIMLILAAICLLIYPLDIYRAQLQATQRFHIILGAELAKHLVALAAFLILIAQGQSLEIAIITQFAVIAIFHIVYFILFARKHIDFQNILAGLRRRLALSAPKQARTYSLAAMLSASLEHIDKILVGWVFGLEFLGLYTLAFSTGRILYNMLKPAFYIYYRRFVDTMPSRNLLVKTGIVFSVLGAICTTLFLFATAHIPAMSKFEDGSAVTVILFLSYGIGIVRALYYQAFALNRASVARHALIASTQAACVSLVLLAFALSMPPAAALLLLALQYPVRDGLTVALLARRQRRQA